ncbi:MAG: glutathione synthase [Thiohalocapsa sp.]|uniref:glutathione synthase n=1 Tax=Thiohalocapsa sp. TaxID=2497641 RepID=UPI0025D92E9A|nr:glutathione synthase [Thiohalocapsa sp.]MCG6942670.1 glutathione synthase [Thiohalocapsa sp.]
MKREVGVVMDPIGSIKIAKDSTFAMLLAAQQRGCSLWYMEIGDLCLLDGAPQAVMRPLAVTDDPAGWFELGDAQRRPLDTLDVVLMRKDPPFDMEYVYATYILELAAARGCLVVNDPRTLRDANEKVFTAHFPDCAPPLTVTRSGALLREFIAAHGDAVLKPLDGMGGRSIFRVRAGDPNTGVIIETLTDHGTRFCMAQRFIPEIAAGDRRVLLVDGEPVPYVLARIPAPDDARGNLAAGARAEPVPISKRERWIAARVGPELRARGVLFAGLDVIGDWLTEVNITSPTCIRELDRAYGLDIAGDLMACIEERLRAR